VNGSFTIEDFASFYSEGGFCKIIINGNSVVGTNTIYTGVDDGQVWVVINNQNLDITFDQAFLTNSVIIGYNNLLNVTNSTFSASGLYGLNGNYDIRNTEFRNSFVDVFNADDDHRYLNILDHCEFSGVQGASAISITNYPNFKIEDCTIFGGSQGIYIYNSGFVYYSPFFRPRNYFS